MNERYELDPRGDVTDNLRSEYRLLKTEFARQSKTAKARTIKVGALWCAFGAALGMTGMVYWHEQTPKPQPVVASPTAVTIDRLDDIERRMALLESAKEANAIRAEQRVMDMRTALDKLEKLKAKQDRQFDAIAPGHVVMPQPWDGGSISVDTTIKQKATELGVSKLVVK